MLNLCEGRLLRVIHIPISSNLLKEKLSEFHDSTFDSEKSIICDMLPFTHPVQWTVGLVGAYTVFRHAMNIYDPANFMKAFQLPTKATARSFAFILVLLNGYDVMGAIQHNWAVYWYAAISRVFAAGIFYSLGPPWSKLVTIELQTLAVIAVGMFFG